MAGLLVVLGTFAYGVEVTASTTVAGERIYCGPAISQSWLVSGTPGGAVPACEQVVQRARVGVLSTMAAGGLLALLGWTALREPREPVSGERPRPREQRPRRPRAPRPGRGGRTATG